MAEANSDGHLTISTELAPSIFADRGSRTEPVIRAVIQDDGPGIPPDVMSSIFDPFFTTKPEGKGTGLGLSVCHGIVSEHGGHIWAENEPSQPALGSPRGATFFVELPVVEPELGLQSVGPYVPDSGRLSSGETSANNKAPILVVDDEIDVLDFLMRALQSEGYRVDAVIDGEAALACLAETDYDLIVCDLRMPGLSGLEVFRQAQATDPNLAQRFMFITGDTVSPGTRSFLSETGAPYLVKPFGMADFVEKVRVLLEPRRDGASGHHPTPRKRISFQASEDS